MCVPGAIRRILATSIFVLAAISTQPLNAADAPVPDRLPDDYTEDGKPVWYPFLNPEPVQLWEVQFGARYFPSSGKTKITLYDAPPGNILISQLTYSNLTAHSGEIFGKAEHLSGFFVKGYAGGGLIPNGNLQDQDFPPVIFPSSSTDSQQRDGRLAYVGHADPASRDLSQPLSFDGPLRNFESAPGAGFILGEALIGGHRASQ